MPKPGLTSHHPQKPAFWSCEHVARVAMQPFMGHDPDQIETFLALKEFGTISAARRARQEIPCIQLCQSMEPIG